MTSAGPSVRLDHVSVFVRPGQTLDDVSFLVEHGQAVALVGLNGSGKRLALRVAAGLEMPLTGEVRLLTMNPAQLSEDEAVALRGRVGVVFDRPALLSNMSVFNNVALPLRYHTRLSSLEITDRVMAALEAWGLTHFRDCFPAELAFGDARLIAIVRARILQPEILFIDDMVAGLDARGLAHLRDLLENARTKRIGTLVVSTNAPTPLLEIMDRLFFFNDGRLVADCTPAEVGAVKDRTVQELFSA